MPRHHALFTVAIVAGLLGALYMAALAYQAVSRRPQAQPATAIRPALTLDQQTRLEALVDAARKFKQCVNPELAKETCDTQFQVLANLLAETDNQLHDFYRPGFFETFINGDVLVLRRNRCTDDDVAGNIMAWSAWSRNKEPETEAQRLNGQYGAFHPFNSEGRRIGNACLMVIQLPLSDLKRINLGLLDNSKINLLWMMDQRW